MAIKIHLNFFFSFVIKKFDFPVNMPPEKEVCEFIPFEMYERF